MMSLQLQNLAETYGGRLLVLCAVLLMTAQIFVCLQAQRQHRSRLSICFHALHALIGFSLTTCLLDGIYRLPDPDTPYARIAPVVHLLFSLPWTVIMAAELISAMFLVISYRDNRYYAKTHLLSSSIKEAMDLLPAGICFGNENGAVVLTNLKMNKLCRDITGTGLTDTNAFWQELCRRGEDQNGQKIIKTTDGEALLFAKNEITVDGKAYDQIISSDVTGLYRITAELSDKNDRLRDIQIRMKAYQAQAADMVISQEILNARRIVHDDVGHALLAARYYFEHPESGNEPVLLSMMNQTNTMLLREAEQPDDMEHDRYLDALKMANAIGVTVEQSGKGPKGGSARDILGQTIGECAANTAKHAGGDRLIVTVKEREGGFSFTVTNNGTPPKEPIIETGGLLSLRHVIEKAGGSMTVDCVPSFRLVIWVPTE